MTRFGTAIRKARKARRPPLTQKEVGERVGVEQAYISMLERDLRIPGRALQRRLARVLKVSIAALQCRAS